MYFLEFDEMNKEGEYCIQCPLTVDIRIYSSGDNEDHIPYDERTELVSSCLKSLLDPLIKMIGDDPDMKIVEQEYMYEDTWVIVSCPADKVDSCVEKLKSKCKELDGSFEEDEEEFELDLDEPYVQNFDPRYGYYETSYHWGDEDERYNYYHATLEVKVTFEYNENYLEIYRK